MACSKLRPKGCSLPDELVEETLERVPIESLVRFKSICKQWNGLLNDDKRFIEKHLDLSREQQRHDMIQIINPVTLDLLSLPVPDEFISREFCDSNGLFAVHNNALQIVHCDGLLLCSVGDRRGRFKLAIWNPLLSQIKWVQPLSSYHSFDEYGFGYDKKGSYKILRRYRELGSAEGYEIYDVKSKLWTAFPATFDWNPTVLYQHVSMKGNMYWLADNLKSAGEEFFIQSFDFSRETFKPICSSLPFEVRYDFVHCIPLDIVALSGFNGDKLSLLHQPYNTREIKIDVWVSNKVSDELVSWTKYFNVARPDLPVIHPLGNTRGNPAYFLHKTNGIMLWCDKALQGDDEAVQEEDDKAVLGDYACANFYEISQGEIRKQVETGPRYRAKDTNPCIYGCVYVPSLLPVPE